MKKNFNQNLLWKKIFLYTKYKDRSELQKKFIDIVFKKLVESIFSDIRKYDTLTKIDTNVYSLKDYDYKNLKTNHKFWMIDNKLGIIITGLFGSHLHIRPILTFLHLFIENKITDDFINELIVDNNFYYFCNKNKYLLSDVYIAMEYGIYESGEDKDIHNVGLVIMSSNYNMARHGQNIIRNKYKIDSVEYSKEEALDDFNHITLTF